MALKIRLQRGGKTHSPRYRLVVAESSARRDGKFVEVLGNYNPQARKNEKELDIKLDRIDHWLKVGAKPTDTARTIINRVRRAEGPVEAAAPAEKKVAPAPEPAAVVEAETPAEPEAGSEATQDSPEKSES